MNFEFKELGAKNTHNFVGNDWIGVNKIGN